MSIAKEDRTVLRPVMVRGAPTFSNDECEGLAADLVNDGTRVPSADNTVSKKYHAATIKIDEAQKSFSVSLDRFIELERLHTDAAKRASSNVRDAAEKLAQGLGRIEKVANFTRLESYVILLERAAVAMKSLAELEATGKLEKIAGALRS